MGTMMKVLFAMFLFGCSVGTASNKDGGHSDLGTHDLATDRDFSTSPDLVSSDLLDLPDLAIRTMNIHPAAGGPMIYFGGPVMQGVVTIYPMWYGTWEESRKDAIKQFIDDLDGSDYAYVWSLFGTGGKVYQRSPYAVGIDDGGVATGVDGGAPTGRFVRGPDTDLGYPLGMWLASGDVQSLVTGTDAQGIYVVFTSPDVGEGLFCVSYCGYHESANEIKYAFVGDPGACLDSCSAHKAAQAYGIPNPPSGDWRIDAMLSVLAHEIGEAVTDPEPTANSAWQDVFGFENGDMCAWRFDPVYELPGGRMANLHLRGTDYLIQQTWVPVEEGYCGLRQ